MRSRRYENQLDSPIEIDEDDKKVVKENEMEKYNNNNNNNSLSLTDIESLVSSHISHSRLDIG